MFIIISPILTFFGDRWDRQARMRKLKGGFEPKKIVVSPLDSFGKTRGLDDVGDIGLLKNSSFFFFEFENFYFNIFIEEFIGRDFLALDYLREVFLLGLIVKLKILSAFFDYILPYFLHSYCGRFSISLIFVLVAIWTLDFLFFRRVFFNGLLGVFVFGDNLFEVGE